MNTLFPVNSNLPDGFYYTEEFLTESEEADLLVILSQFPLQPLIFQGFEAKRKVCGFGVDYLFDSRKIAEGKPIPESFSFLLAKASEFTSIPKNDFAEMLVTEYPAGAVINWHRDGPPFEVIVGISLLSDCTFLFRPYDKTKRNRNSLLKIPVARRSLYVIKGEARYEWEHSIKPVKERRYSITLRTLKIN